MACGLPLGLALVERFGGMRNVVDSDRVKDIGSRMKRREYWTENRALRSSIQCILALLILVLMVLVAFISFVDRTGFGTS